MRRFNTMALDADAEPLTRDDIDGIITTATPSSAYSCCAATT